MRKPNTYCSDCHKPFYRRPCEIIKWKKQYCNICKKKHMAEFAKEKNTTLYVRYIMKWKAGAVDGMRGKYSISRYIIRYLFEKFDNKCSKCGWHEVNPFTGKVPLDVEHIDGNYKNNKEENLDLLCPNCHSLTPTYKGANRGRGRKERKKYAGIV